MPIAPPNPLGYTSTSDEDDPNSIDPAAPPTLGVKLRAGLQAIRAKGPASAKPPKGIPVAGAAPEVMK
jgi:hypothetical protein